jgi:hypothetical protein
MNDQTQVAAAGEPSALVADGSMVAELQAEAKHCDATGRYAQADRVAKWARQAAESDARWQAERQALADLTRRVETLIDKLERKGKDQAPCDDYHDGYKFSQRSTAARLRALLSPPPSTTTLQANRGMIQCPKCNNWLATETTKCLVCGTDTDGEAYREFIANRHTALLVASTTDADDAGSESGARETEEVEE